MRSPYLVPFCLLVATPGAIAESPPQASENADWRARCPVVLTREDLKARPAQFKRIKEVSPGYPRRLHASSTEGSAEIMYVIDTEGAVVDIREVRSTHPEFFEALAAAVSQWRFTKPVRDGNPVCVEVNLSMNFTLQ